MCVCVWVELLREDVCQANGGMLACVRERDCSEVLLSVLQRACMCVFACVRVCSMVLLGAGESEYSSENDDDWSTLIA